MKRAGRIAFLLAAPVALAQIRDLATTTDGSEVFFSSSARPIGSQAPAPTNSLWSTSILRFRQGTWSIVETSHGGVYPSVTGDGKIVSWIEEFGCGSCMGVVPRSTARFSGFDDAKLKIPRYEVSFSRNGRFAFFPGYMGTVSPAVQDLETGAVWDNAAGGVPFSPTRIADDGSVLGLKGSAGNPIPNYARPLTVVRWRPNGAAPEDVFSALQINRVALAAHGKRAIIETPEEDARRRLWLLDVETRERRLIADVTLDRRIPTSTLARISLNAEGSRAIFLWTFGLPDEKPQVHFWDAQAGGGTAPLEGLPEGASDAVLSADGSTAWVATRLNRLLRFDLNQSAVEEVLSGFPTSLGYFGRGSAVPGSLIRIDGGSLAAVGGRVRVVDEFDAPAMAGESDRETLVQLPWELAWKLTAPAYTPVPAVAVKDGLPLELPIRNLFASNQLRIEFETIGLGQSPAFAKASAGEEPIGANRPARPGESVRVWFTGLGPLDREVPTGNPGPGDPPARPLTEVLCAIMHPDFSNWQGVETTPVVYAPGRIGLYQLDLKIPATWPPGEANLACYRVGSTDRTDARIPVGTAEQ